MSAHFHKQALELLSIAYEPDPEAMAALAARSDVLGVPLPPSFVEWYGMRNGIALLKQHSNCDEPIEIADLGARRSGGRSNADTPLLLEFMDENQHVCTWAIQLDDGDDPPVYVAADPGFAWCPCADRFSTFIECQVWDYLTIGRLWVSNQPLQPSELTKLRGSFRERATTHGWPTPNTYRFERGDVRILLHASGDQSDWWISADSEQSLASVANELWPAGARPVYVYGNDDMAERVVDMMRSEP